MQVSIYVYSLGWNQDIRTVLMKHPLTSGQKVAVWDGTMDNGEIVPPEITYYISVPAWPLPDTALIVERHPFITNVTTTPHFFNPGDNPYEDPEERGLKIDFFLSKDADVEATIWDFNNNLVKTIVAEGLKKGANRIIWDGRDDRRYEFNEYKGYLRAPGYYRVRLVAKDRHGNQSDRVYSIFKICALS